MRPDLANSLLASRSATCVEQHFLLFLLCSYSDVFLSDFPNYKVNIFDD
jgi:hypothetical protein